MALQKEIWIKSIVDGLWPDGSFMSKAVNDDQYVSNKTVHIPNAGSASKVVMDRTTLPATSSKRTDAEITYDLHEFTTDPVLIQFTEELQLSYNKRESVIKEDRANLVNFIEEYMLQQWAPDTDKIISTTGASVLAHTDKASGNRASLTTDDVLVLMAKFNSEDIPQEGRYLLLDAFMYQQLIKSMSQNEMASFQACADLKNGVMGKFGSFNVMMRSTVLRYATGGSIKKKSDTGAATDNAAGLAWYEGAVSRSKGEVKMFSSTDDPGYYGDIYSFLVNAGGSKRRTDKKGVWVIRQGAVAAE